MGYSILGAVPGEADGEGFDGEERGDGEKEARPDFFLDLNLDQVMARVWDERSNYDLKRYYYGLPTKVETVEYRQAVYRDLGNDALYNGVLAFSNEMELSRELMGRSGKSLEDLQKKRWLLDANYHYVKAVTGLHRCLVEGKPESLGLRRLGEMVGELVDGGPFGDLVRDTDQLREGFDQMRVHIDLTKEKMVISREAREENYLERLVELFPETEDLPMTVENPFAGSLKLSSFEQKILEVLQKNVPEAFAGLHGYYKRYKDCMKPFLFRFEEEVQFYLAFRMYQEKMESIGCRFAIPTMEGCRFAVGGAYDLALAWSIHARNRYGNRNARGSAFGENDTAGGEERVVCNDARYEEKEKFFVITGPNQGGKTTFARSMGQVVYFSLMGLPAPCTSAEVPMFTGMLTHFSVEESLDTGRGKLKEELTRLHPMIHFQSYGKFVVINELFTTAATYDAYIMGKRVMEHFIRKNCYGVYVTHIQELASVAEGNDISDSVASLVAELDDADKRVRTFKVTRREAEEGGYANAIVDKYQLNYEDIKARLEKKTPTAFSMAERQ